MNGGLKEWVARGVAWSMAEKIGTALVQMGVRIVLLRLLLPEDLGAVAVLMAFSTVALVVVDSGFSQTLIRKAVPSSGDFTSVFVFNVAVSLVLYLLLTAVSPFVADYYDMPLLAQLAPVFYLLLPANALGVVQMARFARQFRFELLSKVTFAASVASGFAAVIMALAGWGIWSIVAQQVLTLLVRAALLWWLSDWRPCASFDGAALRRMAPYSFRLMASDLISALYNKLPQFFLGRMYASDTLGYFDQAQKLKDLPVTSTTIAVLGVTFPALSRIRDDRERFAESYRQIVMVVAFVLFPVMLGMSAVAPDMFAVLLGERWMPTVPYFETICLAGLFYPVAQVAYNVLKVQSDGAVIVRLEAAKKVVLTAIFCVTIPRSVEAVVWGLVFFALFEMAINFLATIRFTSFTLLRFVRTLLPVALVAAAMYCSVRLSVRLLPDDALLRLVAGIAVGVASYVGLAALFRLEAFRETLGILRKQLLHR